ncbi:hypothetical protein BLNAU_1580 [Blattamonas nauphoetae]|uniref:Uncharacterized protein n=1 Tax=Blattamonas nauphoetae TaxID=2049346 RepID=A0ABQ9YIH3_9EUKA|nr:hypothetical protein BLNAU_1580 [Blattamonas nauphoetae]
MTAIDKETDSTSSATCSNMSSPHVACSTDCSLFLNWTEEQIESTHKMAIIFRSLVATLKLQPTLDASLETKALKFLFFVTQMSSQSANAFLGSLASLTDDSLTKFIQCIVVLVSSVSKRIISKTMKMLNDLLLWCSSKVRLTLVRADLIPQLVITLNPLSLSFTEAVGIHNCLVTIISHSVWLSTQNGLASLKIEDRNEQQAVRETVFKQVIAPSEKYICHLCVNRVSIVYGDQSEYFMTILAQILAISPYYQPAMDLVLNMPVFVPITNCLTFFEADDSIWSFLFHMNNAQRERNKTGGIVRQMGKKIDQMLRKEGIEDVIEEKLQNDKDERRGRWIVPYSIKWSNLLDMNLPQPE